VVKIFACLELEQNWAFFKDLEAKAELQRASIFDISFNILRKKEFCNEDKG